MPSFTCFVVSESVRTADAKVIANLELEHRQDLLNELREELAKSWQDLLNKLKLKPEETTHIELLSKGYKLVDEPILQSTVQIGPPTYPRPIVVGPAVLLPTSLSLEVRRVALHQLLEDATTVFNHALDNYFQLIGSPNRFPLEVASDSNSVKLLIATNVGGHERQKVLAAVQIEHAKPTSRAKPADQIYLVEPHAR